MLKIEKTVLPSPEQWEIIIEGMRNPMNSWDKSDSHQCGLNVEDCPIIICEGIDANPGFGCYEGRFGFCIGEKDANLMKRLAKGGAVHAKYRRMIPIYLTINAPLYWWKEFDTYKVGTVCNSCSTMHKIHSKEFTMDDFSIEHLEDMWLNDFYCLEYSLNEARRMFLETKDKKYWHQMIQLLPTSYNQKRTVMLNYEVLVNIYHSRKNHKLDEWHDFCHWIEQLPYSELITGKDDLNA